jgi:hypothetical protein
VPEAQDASRLVLDVVRGCRVDVRVAQLLARGRQTVARVDCEPNSLRSVCSGVFLAVAAVDAVGRVEGWRWRVALDDELILRSRVIAVIVMNRSSPPRGVRSVIDGGIVASTSNARLLGSAVSIAQQCTGRTTLRLKVVRSNGHFVLADGIVLMRTVNEAI